MGRRRCEQRGKLGRDQRGPEPHHCRRHCWRASNAATMALGNAWYANPWDAALGTTSNPWSGAACHAWCRGCIQTASGGTRSWAEAATRRWLQRRGVASMEEARATEKAVVVNELDTNSAKPNRGRATDFTHLCQMNLECIWISCVHGAQLVLSCIVSYPCGCGGVCG